MFATRLFQLLMLVLALACVAHAVVPQPRHDGLEARQVTDPGNDDDEDNNISLPVVDLPTVTSDPGEATTTDPPEDETTTTVDETTTTTEQDEETTTEPDRPTVTTTTTTQAEETTTTTEADSTTTTAATSSENEEETTSTTTRADEDATSTTTTRAPASTSSDDNEDNEDEETTTRREPVTSTFMQTITRTNSDGDVFTTTSQSVTTTLVDVDGADSGGGLSPQTRNIVIGVVVGVGGAIILGALAIVYWRIRNRKKLAEENDGLMEYNGGYSTVDKSEPPVPGSSPSTAPTATSTRSPFQSTLENYHQPSQPVNASSNF